MSVAESGCAMRMIDHLTGFLQSLHPALDGVVYESGVESSAGCVPICLLSCAIWHTLAFCLTARHHCLHCSKAPRHGCIDVSFHYQHSNLRSNLLIAPPNLPSLEGHLPRNANLQLPRGSLCLPGQLRLCRSWRCQKHHDIDA